MDRIKIAMVAPAFPCYPVWVAQERGFFAARNIECSTEVVGTTDRVTSSLQSNACQMGMGSPEGIIGDAAGGGSLRLVAGNANRAPLSLIGLKTIKRSEDLRGKRVGTSSLKEGTAILVQKMLAAHGLHYPNDYELAIVGAHPERWEHLQKGTIDASLQLIPYNYIAEAAGFPNLGDVAKYIPDYAFAAIAVNLNWANLNRHLTVRALAALREAVEWTSQKIEEVAKLLTTVTHANLPHAHRALAEMLQGGVSPADLHINKKALDAVFENMHDVNLVSKDVELSYGICVDESFLCAS